MRLYFHILIISLFYGCATKSSVVQLNEKQSNERPNIILIMADDLGYETIGINGGSSYSTPHIDQIARGGIHYDHCYAQPLCTPSRVKIMTGINNVRNYVHFGLLHESQTTFGHIFQDAGYKTAIIGKWQLGKDPKSPQTAGFDEHCLWQVSKGRIDSTGRDTRFSAPVLETNGEIASYGKDKFGPDIVSQYGLDFMERSVSEGEPFLLYYPMILTHCPFSPTPNSQEWAIDDTTVMEYKGHAHYFDDMMSYTDDIIGRITAKLQSLNIQDNTMIIFTGDNGTDVPIVSTFDGRSIAGAKGKSTDAGTRVPLAIQWPKKIKPGQHSQHLIDFSDILPTMCDAASIPIPESLDLDGHSFLADMTGNKYKPRDYLYNWYSRSGNEKKAKVFARNQKFKLYNSGQFFDVTNDHLERMPLNLNRLSAEERKTYRHLKEVIDTNASKRLSDIPISAK